MDTVRKCRSKTSKNESSFRFCFVFDVLLLTLKLLDDLKFRFRLIVNIVRIDREHLTRRNGNNRIDFDASNFRLLWP